MNQFTFESKLISEWKLKCKNYFHIAFNMFIIHIYDYLKPLVKWTYSTQYFLECFFWKSEAFAASAIDPLVVPILSYFSTAVLNTNIYWLSHIFNVIICQTSVALNCTSARFIASLCGTVYFPDFFFVNFI